MKKKRIKMIGSVVFFLVIIASASIVLALGYPDNPAEGFRYNTTTNYMQIWAHSSCVSFFNDSAGSVTKDYFLPTRTSTEFLAMRDHLPFGVLNWISCDVNEHRVSEYSGWVNMHTNDSGVWVHDPDCTSGASYTFLEQCQKWWPESINTQFFVNEHIYGWKAGECSGSYLENWTKPTYRCILCTQEYSDETACEAAGCYWHSYNPTCSIYYCYGYGTSTECQDAGCFWSGSGCFGAQYCDTFADETECNAEMAYYEDPCDWDSYNICCYDGGNGYCNSWNGLLSQCQSAGCTYNWDNGICHAYCYEG